MTLINHCMINKDQDFRLATEVMFHQMRAYEVIKTFGKEAIAALVKEIKQLDEGAVPGKPIVEPIDQEILTQEEKDDAINMVTVIKKII